MNYEREIARQMAFAQLKYNELWAAIRAMTGADLPYLDSINERFRRHGTDYTLYRLGSGDWFADLLYTILMPHPALTRYCAPWVDFFNRNPRALYEGSIMLPSDVSRLIRTFVTVSDNLNRLAVDARNAQQW
jgi:hypothetical protein